ncbi:hypothetical protein KY366_04605 [Candidatus Woesearchaeota archaeon]|nr:hypothetical protein [Candidatus Woesearchaeota archaeon]
MGNKKAAIGLSVTAIVILILAIVMLGLGVGFIKGMFTKVSTQIEQQIAAEPEPYFPTASSPVSLSREMIMTNAGAREVIKVSTFNPTDETWDSVEPVLSCDSLVIAEQSANERDVRQGKIETFNLLFTVPLQSPGSYLCSVGIEDYNKDLTIEIME